MTKSPHLLLNGFKINPFVNEYNGVTAHNFPMKKVVVRHSVVVLKNEVLNAVPQGDFLGN
jgi:hypothetical protein